MINGLIPACGLSAAQLEQIQQLAEQCNQAEGLMMKLNWTWLQHRPVNEVNDFLYYLNDQLVGFLGLYNFNNEEVELSVMVAPPYRQQGIFTGLLAEARCEVQRRNIPSLLFICEQSSVGGQMAMQAIGAAYEFSEYRMDLRPEAAPPVAAASQVQLKAAEPADIRLMAAMDETCFNVPAVASAEVLQEEFAANGPKRAYLARLDGAIIGKIHIISVHRQIIIAAFCILPEYRGQGHGSVILARVVAELLAQGQRHISLEVETKNERALNIYRRCGFEVTTAYNYYRLPNDFRF